MTSSSCNGDVTKYLPTTANGTCPSPETVSKVENKGHCHWLIENKTTVCIPGTLPLEDCCKCGVQNFFSSECSHSCHLQDENKNSSVIIPVIKTKPNGDLSSDDGGFTNDGFISDCGKDVNGVTTTWSPYNTEYEKTITPPPTLNNTVLNGDCGLKDNCKLTLEYFYSKKEERQGRKLSTLSTGSRKYYKNQDKLIESYEETVRPPSDKLQLYRMLQKKTNFYAKLSFAANVVLLIAKSTAAIMSGSIAIITSLVDSVVDLCSGVVVWITTKAIRKTDPYKYPTGRKRMEPLAIVVLSVIMGLASLQLIKEAVQKMVGLMNGSQAPPTVDFLTIGISSATIVIKLLLYLLCRKVASPTVKALAQDHRNDVISNTLAILCGYIGSQEMQSQTQLPYLIYVDPGGAILISLYIVVTWYITGKEQAKTLTGKTAEPIFISKITWLCMNFHEDILCVKAVKVYYSGYDYTVEVVIGLPADMTVEESVEITGSLTEKLESVTKVDRAYVHTRHIRTNSIRSVTKL